jgi:hypothetical protein
LCYVAVCGSNPEQGMEMKEILTHMVHARSNNDSELPHSAVMYLYFV